MIRSVVLLAVIWLLTSFSAPPAVEHCCKCVPGTVPGGGTVWACPCTYNRGGTSCNINFEGCTTVGTCLN